MIRYSFLPSFLALTLGLQNVGKHLKILANFLSNLEGRKLRANAGGEVGREVHVVRPRQRAEAAAEVEEVPVEVRQAAGAAALRADLLAVVAEFCKT